MVLFALLGGLFPAPGMELMPLHATNTAAQLTIVQGENLLHAFQPESAVVEEHLNLGLMKFSRSTSVANGWRTIIHTNDTIGIKVFSQPGQVSGTRPAVVAAVVNGLRAAGVPGENIIIWDKRENDLRAAGFFQLARQLGVQAAGAMESGYDTNTFYLPDSPVSSLLVWGDVEFGRTNENSGKKSYVTRLLTGRITKIISIAPLMNENAAGTCGHFFSLALGSVDNTRRFTIAADRLAVALPEIYALPAIGDRVALLITDALLVQYQGGPASYLQFSSPRSELWFSRDPVALDTIALKELAKERKRLDLPAENLNLEIFQNAALLQLGITDISRIMIERMRPD
jgi:hypothetical protein